VRVLLVSQEYPPETAWGGIGTYVGLHAPALAALGHEVHVLSVVDGQEAGDVERDGVTIHRRGLARRVRGPGRIAKQSWTRLELAHGVAAHVRALPPADVVETPEWMAESLFLRNTRLVVRLHSSAAQIFPFVGRHGPDARCAIALEDRAMRRADLLVGSAVQLPTVRGRRGFPPVVEIPYPIGVRPPRPAADDGPPRIVFAGRFEPRKGVDRLVEALPFVRREVPDARLELVGRDTTTSDGASVVAALRDRAAALGVGDAIDVVEAWGTAAVESRLQGAAVCAVPSRWESFGYVAAEALAGATPTVVSSWASLAAIAGRSELVVAQDDDPRAWAATIVELLLDPAAARTLALTVRERLVAEASPSVVAARTAEAYAGVS
jgi:glycogen synthase